MFTRICELPSYYIIGT